jgi:hypothetical protein
VAILARATDVILVQVQYLNRVAVQLKFHPSF